MRKLIGAGHFFSASHRDPVRQELHGHTYEVVAWWMAQPEHDLVMLQDELKLPLSAADSTNCARNIGIDKAWRGTYVPLTKKTRTSVLVERIESENSLGALDLTFTDIIG